MSEIRDLAYTTREAAQRLGVSESTVRNYVKRGLLPAYRMGNRLLISRQAVEEMIERMREALSGKGQESEA